MTVSGTFAADTKVSPEKSRAELETTLKRYGATAFGYGYEDGPPARAVVVFAARGRRIRFEVEVPALDEFTYTKGNVWRDLPARRAAQEKAIRQRWRALNLLVKAKLESVELGLATFEEEFLAHVLLPDGSTVGQWARPQLEQVYATGSMPSVLPGTPAAPALEAGERGEA